MYKVYCFSNARYFVMIGTRIWEGRVALKLSVFGRDVFMKQEQITRLMHPVTTVDRRP